MSRAVPKDRTAAARSARYRDRQRQLLQRLLSEPSSRDAATPAIVGAADTMACTIRLSPDARQALVDDGFLAAGDRNVTAAVEAAIIAMLAAAWLAGITKEA